MMAPLVSGLTSITSAVPMSETTGKCYSPCAIISFLASSCLELKELIFLEVSRTQRLSHNSTKLYMLINCNAATSSANIVL